MDEVNDKTQSAHRILDDAIQRHKPSLIVLSFSGGYDSMVSSHVAARWYEARAYTNAMITVSADTLLSADGWRDFVTDTAHDLKLPQFTIWETDHFAKWVERMLDAGFPYTEAQHRINFYYLKQVVFRRIIAAYKQHRTDRIMFVNGVRRAESAARVNRPEIARQGCGVFVNAILHWADEDVHNYRLQHNMPINPFYDTFGNSGDCLCNWHTQISLGDVERKAPQVAARLMPVHTACKAKHGYGYGERPVNGYWQGTPQLSLPGFDETPNLCADCRKPAPKNEALEDVIFSRMEW